MINKHNRIYSVLLFFLTRQTTSPSFLTKHINIISYTYNKRSNKFGVLKCIQNEARPPSEWTIYSIVAEPECTKTHNHHTAQSRRHNHTSQASQPIICTQSPSGWDGTFHCSIISNTIKRADSLMWCTYMLWSAFGSEADLVWCVPSSYFKQ